MPITYATDHAGFERALVTWMQTYASLAADSVRWRNQITGRPDKPYATLHISSDGGAGGQDAEFEQFNSGLGLIEKALHGSRRFTLQCEMYSVPETAPGQSGARIRLLAAVSALRSDPVKELFRANGLAFLQQLSAVQNLDEQLGDRWERRAMADLEFGYTSVLTTTGADGSNWIETMDTPNEADGSLIIQP